MRLVDLNDKLSDLMQTCFFVLLIAGMLFAAVVIPYFIFKPSKPDTRNRLHFYNYDRVDCVRTTSTRENTCIEWRVYGGELL